MGEFLFIYFFFLQTMWVMCELEVKVNISFAYWEKGEDCSGEL